MLEGKKVTVKVGGDFQPVPNDKYTVQITDVNLVMQFNKFKAVEEEMLNYEFTILDENPMPEGDETTRGRLLWQRVSLNIGARSKLGKLFKAVLGRDLTPEEQENLDPESIVGEQVDVMVNQTPSADGTKIYNNVIDVAKTLKKLAKVEKEEVKPVQKKTVSAVAPKAAEDFINNMEEEAKAAKAKKSTETETEEVEETEDDVEAAELEAEAAELAAKAAQAKANAAKKKAALNTKK